MTRPEKIRPHLGRDRGIADKAVMGAYQAENSACAHNF